MIEQPIQPAYGSGVLAAPGAESAVTSIVKGNKQAILTNLGANTCFIRFGQGAITASDKDYPVPPGAQVVVTKSAEDTAIAHISALGTTLHIMAGEGY